MSHKYYNKYRIPSTRATRWDYKENGIYFVTICTSGGIQYFGKVVNGNMVLSEIGKMARQYWMDIPSHFPFVKLDGFVIMPNHIHGIIVIEHPVRTLHVETLHATSLHNAFKIPTTRYFINAAKLLHLSVV